MTRYLDLTITGDDDAVHAFHQAYDVARAYTAPFVVKVACEMMDDIRSEVAIDPDRRIAFVGRDGHSLALAARTLDPEFFDRHCTEVVLSRASVETAVRDLERNAGESFESIHDYRWRKDEPGAEDVRGSYQRLTRYLQAQDLPVGRPGSKITLVDTSYKGTVQELLAAIYPQTSFQGRYAFFGASPHDPHPGTKRGYVVHLEADQSSGGRPVDALPEDLSLTFSQQEAIGIIEETMHGTQSSPKAFGVDGPVQQPQRFEPSPSQGINPVRVSPAYRDPVIREGVKDINHHAVHDYARSINRRQQLGEDWRSRLDSDFARFQHQAREWVGHGDVDPDFAEVMDSFVRRIDKSDVNALQAAVSRVGLSDDDAVAVWRSYDRLQGREDKRAFVTQFKQRYGL